MHDNEFCVVGSQQSGFSLVFTTECSHTIRCSRIDGSAVVSLPDDHVVTAFRFLVGSTSHVSIPSKILVNGNILPFEKNVKKWYTYQLSEEDILSTLRVGFVPIRVEKAHDSSCRPSIDAVECFGVPRSQLDSWVPKRLRNIDQLVACQTDIQQTERLRKIHSIASLCSTIGLRRPIEPLERSIFEDIVVSTAFSQSKGVKSLVQDILTEFDPDEPSRQLFIDRGILRACTQSILECLASRTATPAESKGKLISILRAASDVASSQPVNYLQAMDQMPSGIQSDARYVPKRPEY